MIEISHLVVNGCSFTYCQGLDNPQIDGWPALLAKKLKIPVVNLAMLGSGCDGIYRRTVDYFYKNLDTKSKPFYIISWSDAIRREEFLYTKDNKEFNDYSILHLAYPTSILEHELAYHLNKDTIKAAEKRKYNYWAGIINLLENNKVPYFMNDFMPCDDNMEIYLKENYTNAYNFCINNKYRLTECKSATLDAYLPCGHINEEGNKNLAEYIYDEFIKLYPEYKIVQSDYLKLKDFPIDKIHWNNNKWK